MHLWGMQRMFVNGIECNEDDSSQFHCCVNILLFLIMLLVVVEFIKYLWKLIGLLSIYHNNNWTFQWTLLLDKCFQSIKAIAMWSPILKPVDFNRNAPVWVIMDGSQTGISVMYGQGKNWDTCWLAGSLSKKLMIAQHNYHTHEHKTLVVLEALMKWEDKLLGRKFTVVTDHKSLEYFKTQPNLSPRQTRWWENLSHFNYNPIHLDGMQNQVADSLSCYYEYDIIEDNMILLRIIWYYWG